MESYTGPKYTKSWAWSGQCSGDQHAGCRYYRYEKVSLADQSRFDQRGVAHYQLSFPVIGHIWGALRLVNQASTDLCVAGGAVIGRNPLAMTWSTDTGSKVRKNNFISVGSSVKSLIVEGVRIHNNHDPFYTSTVDPFVLRDSWITWNRDDLFESDLNVRILDTLVDGTYTFLSAPDSCKGGDLAGHTTVIEDSLIRVQRMPGRYGKNPATKYHWVVEGGFNALWKPDAQCGGWPGFPKFELRNNVFLVEGRQTKNSSLPSPDNSLGNIVTCQNNLFLYFTGDKPEGAQPQPGGKHFNASNPDFLPNGKDCFQRVTDATESRRIWREKRELWIARHTGATDPKRNVMTIPGVDYSVFSDGRLYQSATRRPESAFSELGTDRMSSSAAAMGLMRSCGTCRRSTTGSYEARCCFATRPGDTCGRRTSRHWLTTPVMTTMIRMCSGQT